MSKVDWSKLGFDIQKTNSYIKYTFNGQWDNGVSVETQDIQMSVYASSIHYGQSCFEGLKAFRLKNNSIKVFRPTLNYQRLQRSCKAVAMPCPTEEMFLEAIQRLIKENADFVPPYGYNGSMYIRPIVFGTGPVLGLDPSNEYYFIVLGNPVGDYYKGGLRPCKALIQYGFDRAAPNGMGRFKVAGNYAPVIPVTQKAKEQGFMINLFLDPREQKYIEEFATSNFVALTKEKDGKRTLVTPKSNSILQSITNMTLCEIAAYYFGWNVERRRIEWEEVVAGCFQEIAACGTAVVITPVNEIHREYAVSEPVVTVSNDIKTLWQEDQRPETRVEVYKYASEFEGFKKLYEVYRGIQNGEEEDTYKWLYPI